MKKVISVAVATSLVATLLAGCGQQPTTAQVEMAEQNKKKMDQAAKVMSQVQTPEFTRSLERENIRERLVRTNDPNQLTWVYPMSAGRVLGRFPVRGKVTSGNKRLTSTQMFVRRDGGEFMQDFVVESPDETGAYGSSASYIFWFDPAGNGPFQHSGDYLVSPVPYKIDEGFGTIKYEVDQKEESKRTDYENQIKGAKK